MKIKHCKICGKELNDKSSIFYMMEECSDCVWKRGEITFSTNSANVDDLKTVLSENGININSCIFEYIGNGNWFVKIPCRENVEVLKDFESVQKLKDGLMSNGLIYSDYDDDTGNMREKTILIPIDPDVRMKFNHK